MYIHNKPVAALYKLLLGAFALVLEWVLLSQYGPTALRLFPTWVLFVAAVYFLSSSLSLTLSERRFVGKNLCPVLEGMLIMAFFMMSAMAWVSLNYPVYLPALDTWVVVSLAVVLPVLVLLDWLLFVKKGRWSAMMPFYGLSLPVIYVAMMIGTAEILPATTELRYPLEALNLREFGLWSAAQCAVIAAALALVFGYILYALDFVMSGKLAKHVVLPHLRMVEVDENGNEILVEPEVKIPTPSVKTEKPEPVEKLERAQEPTPKALAEEKSVELSPEEKQVINDLGEAITEAINAEITKQEAAEEAIIEKVEATKVEVTKIVVVDNDAEAKPTPETSVKPKSANKSENSATSQSKKPSQPKSAKSQNSDKKPKTPPKSSGSNQKSHNQTAKSPQKPKKYPKITRY